MIVVYTQDNMNIRNDADTAKKILPTYMESNWN